MPTTPARSPRSPPGQMTPEEHLASHGNTPAKKAALEVKLALLRANAAKAREAFNAARARMEAAEAAAHDVSERLASMNGFRSVMLEGYEGKPAQCGDCGYKAVA